jgi:hypothetical protein
LLQTYLSPLQRYLSRLQTHLSPSQCPVSQLQQRVTPHGTRSPASRHSEIDLPKSRSRPDFRAPPRSGQPSNANC